MLHYTPGIRCVIMQNKKNISHASYSYADRLSMLKLYSLQRRRDRYTIIYVWKI